MSASDSLLKKYKNDPKFAAMVNVLTGVIEHSEGEFTTSELREAFTVAVLRWEMLRVRPIFNDNRFGYRDEREKFRSNPITRPEEDTE